MGVSVSDVKKFLSENCPETEKSQMIKRVSEVANADGVIDSVTAQGILGWKLYPKFFAEYECLPR